MLSGIIGEDNDEKPDKEQSSSSSKKKSKSQSAGQDSDSSTEKLKSKLIESMKAPKLDDIKEEKKSM